MESVKIFLAVALLCFVGSVWSVPVAPLTPSEEARVAEPEVPKPDVAAEPAKVTEDVKVTTTSETAKPHVDAAENPEKDAATGDLNTADTILLGFGLPGFYAGYGPVVPPFYAGPAPVLPGYGLPGYGLPYHRRRWGPAYY